MDICFTLLPLASYMSLLAVCRCRGSVSSNLSFLKPVCELRLELQEAFGEVLVHGLQCPALDVAAVHTSGKLHLAEIHSVDYTGELETVWGILLENASPLSCCRAALPGHNDLFTVLRNLNQTSRGVEMMVSFLEGSMKKYAWIPQVTHEEGEGETELTVHFVDILLVHFAKRTLEGSLCFKSSRSLPCNVPELILH